MRLVVDTNVLISAGLKKNSLPNDVVHRLSGAETLLKSASTERELIETLARARLAPLIAQEFRDFVLALLAGAEEIEIEERLAACRDPKDDKFLELAVNGRADAIITGDGDLLALGPFRNIPVLTPAMFLRRVAQP